MCETVELNLQGFMVIADFYSLDFGAADVILRIEWLRTLGETSFNWDELWMKFQKAGQTMTLWGDPSLSQTMVSLQGMFKTFQTAGSAYYIEFGCLQMQTTEEPVTDERIGDLLAQHEGLFDVITEKS